MSNSSATVPSSVGPYEVFEQLGAGGMGVVYKGASTAGEEVAVKQIRGLDFTDEDRARFAAEIEALKAVYGARVAPFIEGDAQAEQPWLAMKYLPGATLRSFVGERGPLEPLLVGILGAVLAEGLKSIHDAGLLHRDLKPHNIVLSFDGPMIIDFGLAMLTAAKVANAEDSARLTQPGTVVGTLVCMPPEQVRGEELSQAADVYALGATLLYAATGHYPYSGETEYHLMRNIDLASVEPNLTDLPGPLHDAIAAMLANDAGERPSLQQVTSRLVAVVHRADMSPRRARELLWKATAADTPPPDEAEAAGSPTPKSRRPTDEGTSRTSPAPGALRAARKLRAAYARDAAL